MKKLQDFQAEKVELKAIKGGKSLAAAPDTMTIVRQGTEICEVKSDGPDAWPF